MPKKGYVKTAEHRAKLSAARRGKPHFGNSEILSEAFLFKLTPTEYALLRRKSESTGLKMGRWLRKAINNYS
jgi:hypothetical protein